MGEEGNESRNRRMDLNLYLGLPQSPIRRGSDLGSDLALGSILLSSEEISVSTGFAEPLDTHTPYSPTHASYTLDLQAVEPLDADENSPFEHPSYSPQTSYPLISQSVQNGNESLVGESSPHPEYSPYSPSYIPLSPTPPNEPLGEDIDDHSEHVPYSPSYAPLNLTVQDSIEPVIEEDTNHNHTEYVPYSPSYTPASLPVQQDAETHVPYSPTYVPVSASEQVHDNHSNGPNLLSSVAFRPYHPSTQSPGGALQQDLLQCPEVRFRRLIESSRRWPIRRFRSTVPFRVEPGIATSSMRPDHVFQDMMTSERPVESPAIQKVSAGGLDTVEDVEEEVKEKSSGAANFECNVCLDVAKEPVVTSCGHLFCWPCLYQWLHLYCDYKECPVCKGEVTESNITPIYGRGSNESGVEKKDTESGDSGLKIPPRPRGCRLESLRQGVRRPLSRRRLGEEISTWGRIFDEEIRHGNRVEGQEPSLPGILDDASRTVLARLRARRFLREETSENRVNFGVTESSRNATVRSSNSQSGTSRTDELHGVPNSSSLLHNGIDFWHRVALFSLPSSDRIAEYASNVIERMSNNGNHSGPSTSVNPQNSDAQRGQNNRGDQSSRGSTFAADQVSASSTMAIIQGDNGVVNATDEQNGAGSSRSLRRRRRNGASGSLDIDGLHNTHKRRRLN